MPLTIKQRWTIVYQALSNEYQTAKEISQKCGLSLEITARILSWASYRDLVEYKTTAAYDTSHRIQRKGLYRKWH